MSFLGAGPMEILLILLVAFIFLGPERMVDAARLMGKAVREMRRMTAELSEVVVNADDTNSPEAPIVHRRGPSRAEHGPNRQPTTSPQGEETPASEAGPVTFRSAASLASEEDAEAESKQSQA